MLFVFPFVSSLFCEVNSGRCCWEAFYNFAYCGLVGNPHLTAFVFIPFQCQPRTGGVPECRQYSPALEKEAKPNRPHHTKPKHQFDTPLLFLSLSFLGGSFPPPHHQSKPLIRGKLTKFWAWILFRDSARFRGARHRRHGAGTAHAGDPDPIAGSVPRTSPPELSIGGMSLFFVWGGGGHKRGGFPFGVPLKPLKKAACPQRKTQPYFWADE